MMDKYPSIVKGKVSEVLTLMKSGELPKIVEKILYIDGRPMGKWSALNLLFCAIDYKGRLNLAASDWLDALHKMDYRGFRQWNESGRSVKAGERCTYILAPMFGKVIKKYYLDDKGRKIVTTKPPEGVKVETETYDYLKCFRAVPVFEASQTHGKPIVYPKKELPVNLPFKEIADELGLSIRSEYFGGYYGAYDQHKKEIILCTPDEVTFLHELSHAVDDKISGGKLKGGQHADQEIVAQLSANVLAHVLGRDISTTTAYTKEYIEHYGGNTEDIIKLISRIEKVVKYITKLN